MMGKIFGTNNTLALYLIPFLGITIALFAHFSGVMETTQGLESQHATAFLARYVQSAWLQTTVMMTILVFSAWVITAITATQEIHERPNHWASLLFLLIATIHPAMLLWNGFVFANLFLLLALRRILPIYNENIVNSKVFDAGLFIGIAGFFQPSYWSLILIAAVTIVTMRPFKWREYAVLGLGFTVPFYVYAFILFWNNDFDRISELSSMTIGIFDLNSLSSRATNITIYSLLILSLLMVLASMRYSTVQQRKHKQILMLMAVCLLIINTLFSGVHIGQVGGWLCIPLAVLMPFFIQWFKREWPQNSLVFILMILLVLNYLYFPSLG